MTRVTMMIPVVSSEEILTAWDKYVGVSEGAKRAEGMPVKCIVQIPAHIARDLTILREGVPLVSSRRSNASSSAASEKAIASGTERATNSGLNRMVAGRRMAAMPM